MIVASLIVLIYGSTFSRWTGHPYYAIKDIDGMPVGCMTVTEQDAVSLERLWQDTGAVYIEHNPLWARLNAQTLNAYLHTLVAASATGLESYTLITEASGALLWMIGELSFHRRPIQRLHIVGGQVYALGMGVEQCRERARELLSWLSEHAHGRPIFLQSLPVGSPLYEVIHQEKHPFWVLAHTARQFHYALDLAPSVEGFYQDLGYKTRKSVRYSIRALEKEMANRVHLRPFTRPEEVASFLDDAMPISETTYQYRLLNLGLRNRAKLTANFQPMADQGWWRGYILYCRDEPVAFIYGFRVGSSFYYWEVGYRPDWATWSVGTVAVIKLIENLITSDDRPARLDFVCGDHDYKRRLSNRQWEEQSLYLFPRKAGNFLTHRSLQLTNTISSRSGAILDRYNLKSRVKRYFRRRSTDQ